MLSLDPPGPERDCALGFKEEEEGRWGGGSGLPPTGDFPGSWGHDVGLDCRGAPEGAEARAWTVYFYSLLQSCLQQAGLPETQDRSQVPRTGCPGAEVTLCVLGSPSTFLPVLLEGGVQSPGNMLLCLSPAWLAKVPAPERPGETALLVSKAVSFYPGGLTFLDDFVPPRSATYFLAGLGLGPGRGQEAAELARDLACPTGASAELARLLEDRLLTRQLLATQGSVAVPATLAFTYKPPALLQGGGASPALRVVRLSGRQGQEALVTEEVRVFLRSQVLGDALQVAVKLSGWHWRGRQALRLHPRADLGPVVDTVLTLLEKLEEEESVLVEAVCPPAQLPFPGSPPPGPALAVRICAVVCRTQHDRPLLSKVVCSVGRRDQPLRHQTSLPRTLEVALAQCGLGEAAQVAAVRKRRGELFAPKPREHRALPGRRKPGWRDWWDQLHLVESNPNHFASQVVQSFIHFDVTEHRKDEENARLLAELVRARGLQLDGCFSYWDDCLVLTALLCQELGLPCSPPAAMRLAKQKSRTQLHLLHHHGPPWPAASLYAVPCCPLESEADVERAVRQVPLPGVMKLEFGAGAVGVRLVEDAPQCLEHFSRIARDLQGEADHPGIGLGWGNAMLLMEFVEGTEHDVDLVVFGGRLLAAFVSDNGPTRLPGFTETAACMPTGLAPEQEAQLVQAAFRCCLGCGLLDGVFNVELKLTGAGPRLIEINPRMGGFYLRDWILELYGVDLLLAAAMVACGLRPALPAHPRARGHLVGVMCLVSQHLQALSSTASRETLQALHDRGLLRLTLLEEALVPGEYEEPYCSVACAGPSPAEARLRLLGLCQGLGIDGPHYPVAHFLSHFK
ncbi:PREDICTED: carnosine synthase 1 [Condylura cristata]|uniref:carnosine synthase 1 n=1 Tax=Condylura cristata TaxID=143302 RepID=UPI0006431A49|nr:PREDICTED: carnosine synthase 1 [Condylura cristata]